MARLLTLVAPGVFSMSSWLTIVIGVTEATTGSRLAVTVTSESSEGGCNTIFANGKYPACTVTGWLTEAKSRCEMVSMYWPIATFGKSKRPIESVCRSRIAWAADSSTTFAPATGRLAVVPDDATDAAVGRGPATRRKKEHEKHQDCRPAGEQISSMPAAGCRRLVIFHGKTPRARSGRSPANVRRARAIHGGRKKFRLARTQPMEVSSADAGVLGTVGDERRERRSRST